MDHKYGFHVNRTGEDVFDAIKRIKPKIIKALDHDVGFWRRVRSIHPEVFLIGRLYVPNDEQDRFADNPAGAGRAFAERILGLEVNRKTRRGRYLFDAWESYNEIFGQGESADKGRQYDDFQVAFGQVIRAGGFEPIGMNFANGNMLGFDFLNYFPGTLETYTYLGFHEYDWPTMQRLHEENIRQKNEGGMWMTLRYRRTMNEVRQRYPNKHRVIITECGMTQKAKDTRYDDVGWRHPSPPGEPTVTEEDYWQSLLWYNRELMQDDYVDGALLFVVGAVGNSRQWQSFEHLGGVIDRLEAYQASAPDDRKGDSGGQGGEPDGDASQPALEKPLAAAAQAAQAIQFNPEAALQKRIFADNFVPNSPEFTLAVEGVAYVAQRAEHLGSGEVRVYYVAVGDWANVRYLRPTVGRGILSEDMLRAWIHAAEFE